MERSSIQVQDITFFVINYFFSFPENVKKALQSRLYLRKDPRPAFDSVPLNIVNTKYLHAFDLDQEPTSKSYDDHFLIDDHQTIKTNHIIPVHIPLP